MSYNIIKSKKHNIILYIIVRNLSASRGRFTLGGGRCGDLTPLTLAFKKIVLIS